MTYAHPNGGGPFADLLPSEDELQALAEVMAELDGIPPDYLPGEDGGEDDGPWHDQLGMASDDGPDPYELAAEVQVEQLAAIGATVDLAYETERTRAAEDLQPLPRKAEDRTAHLLARIGRGTYTPGGYFRDPDDLANAGDDAPYGCGLIDQETGRCAARYHDAGCTEVLRASAATGDEEAAHAWRGLLMSNTESAIELAASRRYADSWEDLLDAGTPTDLNSYTEMRRILGLTGPASGPQPMRPVRGSYADELGMG
jgi:hypothetical protein